MSTKPLSDALRNLTSWYLWVWARGVLALRKPKVIGITGTVGKTTTREFLVLALQAPEAEPVVGRVGTTIENWNNDYGVPLSILAPSRQNVSKLRVGLLAPWRTLSYALGRSYPDTLVLEFSAGPRGTIARNAARARPHIAIVTTIGPGHLSTFGTVEGVARAKVALAEAVRGDGLVVFGGDDNPHLELMRQRVPVRTVVVGGRGRALAEAITTAVCSYLGVPAEAVDRARSQFTEPPGRHQMLDLGDIRVLNDSYNANPLSMGLALDRLKAASGRRVAILGGMVELGDEETRHHRDIAARARESADMLVGVGDVARLYDPDQWFPSSDVCAAEVGGIVRPGDVVLVKGSGIWKMNRVVFALRDRR